MQTCPVYTTTYKQVLKTVHTTLKRVLRIRVAVSIPIVIVSLVLTILTLITSISPGFIKDYYILLLNTSILSYILALIRGNAPLLTLYSLFKGSLSKIYISVIITVRLAISSGLTELLNIKNKIANKVTKKLGI